jgi:hypothetical protein
MSEVPRFVVVCVACRSPLVLLTGSRDAEGVWLMMCCAGCGATQRAGPLAMEEDPACPHTA